jgi:hypothetical protein
MTLKKFSNMRKKRKLMKTECQFCSLKRSERLLMQSRHSVLRKNKVDRKQRRAQFRIALKKDKRTKRKKMTLKFATSV